MSETGYAIGFRQQLSTTSFEAFELEITVNYFSVYTLIENDSCQFHAKSNELIDAFLACPPD